MTLCNPKDCSPPGTSVHGILQASTLEWVLPFSSPGDLPDPGIKPASLMFPVLAGDFFTTSTTCLLWAVFILLDIENGVIFIVSNLKAISCIIYICWHVSDHLEIVEHNRLVESRSCSVMSDSCDPMEILYSPWNSTGQNTGVGSLSLLQGIFPTQGLNWVFPHCSQILYQLSHKRSPRILEWVAYPFSSRSSQPRKWTGVFCIAGGFFTNWALKEAH